MSRSCYPVRPFEIALAKVAPYLVIGIIDIAICLFAARFLFKVPIRGSLVLIVLVSILYLLVSLLMGLLVSGRHPESVPREPDGAACELHAGRDVLGVCV